MPKVRVRLVLFYLEGKHQEVTMSFVGFLWVDYWQTRVQASTMYGFKGGPDGIMKCKYVELTPDFIYPYRNQKGEQIRIAPYQGSIQQPHRIEIIEDKEIDRLPYPDGFPSLSSREMKKVMWIATSWRKGSALLRFTCPCRVKFILLSAGSSSHHTTGSEMPSEIDAGRHLISDAGGSHYREN